MTPLQKEAAKVRLNAPSPNQAKADGRAKTTPRIGELAESARRISAELVAHNEAAVQICDERLEHLVDRVEDCDARLALLKPKPTLVVAVAFFVLVSAFVVDIELLASTLTLLVPEDASHSVRFVVAAGLCGALALAFKANLGSTEGLVRWLPFFAAGTVVPLAIHRWSVANEQATWQASESELSFAAYAASSPLLSTTLVALMAILSLVVALVVARFGVPVLEALDHCRLRRRKEKLLGAVLEVRRERVRAAASLQAARELFDATKLELQARYMADYERGQSETRDLSSIWRFALATGLAAVAGVMAYQVALGYVAEMPARLIAAGVVIIMFAITMLIRRRPFAGAMARAGAAAILLAATAFAQTVVIVTDHSGSMSQVSQDTWMEAYGAAAARLPQGGSLSVVPVVGSIDKVSIEKLPRFERHQQGLVESFVRREPYRESLLAFKKSLDAAMPTWAANGGASDYQGALRVAADRLKVSASSRKILVILGDLDDGQLRSGRRTKAFSLPPQSLVGVRVFLGNAINTSSAKTREATWRQIDAKVDFWQGILKLAGAEKANIVAIRSNGIGEFSTWIGRELGSEQDEFKPFRNWFFGRKAAKR